MQARHSNRGQSRSSNRSTLVERQSGGAGTHAVVGRRIIRAILSSMRHASGPAVRNQIVKNVNNTGSLSSGLIGDCEESTTRRRGLRGFAANNSGIMNNPRPVIDGTAQVSSSTKSKTDTTVHAVDKFGHGLSEVCREKIRNISNARGVDRL